jgi:DNA-binding NtrC family response regulator
MPHMSGKQLVDRVTIDRPEMKVLYMSGHIEHSIVDHGVLSAEVEFLQKPINPDALARKVRQVLGSRRAKSS